MTADTLYARILELLPFAEIGEDNDGQIVVYTGLRFEGNDIVELDNV